MATTRAQGPTLHFGRSNNDSTVGMLGLEDKFAFRAYICAKTCHGSQGARRITTIHIFGNDQTQTMCLSTQGEEWISGRFDQVCVHVIALPTLFGKSEPHVSDTPFPFWNRRSHWWDERTRTWAGVGLPRVIVLHADAPWHRDTWLPGTGS